MLHIQMDRQQRFKWAGSVDDAQTGLTTGSKFFVQNDGSIGTAASTPSIFAGTAISSTKIIVRK